jgi:hypothetical protein
MTKTRPIKPGLSGSLMMRRNKVDSLP